MSKVDQMEVDEKPECSQARADTPTVGTYSIYNRKHSL